MSALRHSNVCDSHEGWTVRRAGADTCVVEQIPPSDAVREEEQPKLELVPALDEPEALDEEHVDDASTPRCRSQDPLKLYVRQIGDGRLLTAAEERELAQRKDEGDEEAKRGSSRRTCASSCRSRATTRRPASRSST